jgi:hypothetical protein
VDGSRPRNAFIKLDRRFDLPLIAGLARLHHSEEGLRQDFGRYVLGLAVRFDQCDEPEVGCRTDRGHNGRAFGHHCAARRRRPGEDGWPSPERAAQGANIVALRLDSGTLGVAAERPSWELATNEFRTERQDDRCKHDRQRA